MAPKRSHKAKPAVRVHYSVLNHPRYGGVFDDPETRGIVLGIWLIAGRSHASKTGDMVSLGRGDVRWITGRAQDVHAERALRACCELMAYAVRTRGERREITVRNFARKQGFTGRSGGEMDTSQPPSESESESESKEEDLSTKKVTARAGPIAQELLASMPVNGSSKNGTEEHGIVSPIVKTWNTVTAPLKLPPITPDGISPDDASALLDLVRSGLSPGDVCYAIEQIPRQPWLWEVGPGGEPDHPRPITLGGLLRSPQLLVDVSRRAFVRRGGE